MSKKGFGGEFCFTVSYYLLSGTSAFLWEKSLSYDFKIARTSASTTKMPRFIYFLYTLSSDSKTEILTSIVTVVVLNLIKYFNPIGSFHAYALQEKLISVLKLLEGQNAYVF